ncbi:tyrosine-type recombinase/integrase [Trichormus variabilis]|uniref:Integrase n=1 Tax=Trichormus variabilis SAG 1403-4b TaxID=447716 RepID=A0A433UL56_ANAVA|nr:tyrosine-type recombinase/integrase [Trichormus variabilis]MBD2628926.1 tyrosine-type recombinase/integrase [Trichormus variabilis FACHB-164]RUS94578.1 integrase [Trichormus variabilis SAG 1403-4b]
MSKQLVQLPKVGKTEKLERHSPNSRKYSEVRIREHLLPEEVEAMRSAITKSKCRHAHRDSTLILLIYRHGLRVAEVASLRWEQIDWNAGTIYVKRVKKGTPSVQPLYADEIRSLRKLQRDYPPSPYVFQSSRCGPLALDTVGGIVERAGELAGLPFPTHAHMLRHGTGYYLANRGTDTRTIQSYLGHKNIQHTVRYTELASTKFQGLWDD